MNRQFKNMEKYEFDKPIAPITSVAFAWKSSCVENCNNLGFNSRDNKDKDCFPIQHPTKRQGALQIISLIFINENTLYDTRKVSLTYA